MNEDKLSNSLNSLEDATGELEKLAETLVSTLTQGKHNASRVALLSEKYDRLMAASKNVSPKLLKLAQKVEDKS